MKYLLTLLLLTGCNNSLDPDAINNSYKNVSQITCEVGSTKVLHRLRADGKITMEEYVRLYKPAAVYECRKTVQKVFGNDKD